MNYEELTQTLAGAIHSLIAQPDEQDALYEPLYELAAAWSAHTGIPSPPPGKGRAWLLSMAEWVGYTKAFLRQRDPLPPASRQTTNIDTVFFQLMSWIETRDVSDLETHMAGRFLALPPRNRQLLVDYTRRFPFWGELQLKSGRGSMVTERARCLKQHRADFLWLFDRLGDYRSRFALLAFLKNWIDYDASMLGRAKELVFEDYFDLDLPLLGEQDAVLVDVGAFVGDTALSFSRVFGRCRKLYCYEIDPVNLRKAREQTAKLPFVELRQKAVSSQAGTTFLRQNTSDSSASRLSEEGSIAIETVTLDEDIAEPIRFIKMDIEGGEQDALRGCVRHIQEDACQLAISVYHGNQDIWKIPRMIHSMRDTYQFFLRYNGGNLFPSELIFFAL